MIGSLLTKLLQSCRITLTDGLLYLSVQVQIEMAFEVSATGKKIGPNLVRSLWQRRVRADN